MKWCSTNVDEDEKCKWLSAAMDLAGIKQKLTCVERTSVYDCLQRIRDDKADLMAIDSDYGYIARK